MYIRLFLEIMINEAKNYSIIMTKKCMNEFHQEIIVILGI